MKSDIGTLMEPILSLEGICKSYKQHRAVSDISMNLERGKLLTLLGPSGCGKSTLLRMIAGFVEPSKGAIKINGRDVTSVAPENRPTAMVFQNYALFPHMTVFENVAFGLRLRKTSKEEIIRQVAEVLDLIKMRHLEQRYPAQLSGGQQQRVALARCLVIKPEILLLDEPFGALDRSLREDMQVELRKLQRRLSITMLVVTHDQDEAFILSDAVAVMNAGRIEQLDHPTRLYDRPATKFVAGFLGIPNVFVGRTVEHNGQLYFTPSTLPAVKIAVSPDTVSKTAVGIAEQHLALRPESIRLVSPDDERCQIVGPLTFLTVVGSRTICEITTQSVTVHVVLPRSEKVPAVGDIVGLYVEPAHAIVLSS